MNTDNPIEIVSFSEASGFLVWQTGYELETEVRSALADKAGGLPSEWVRTTEWSAAAGEDGVTARWVRRARSL
jgi:hypothetical protein